MQARWYAPELRRFISADTIVPEPGNPQAFNRYAYVYQNPTNNVDPTGHIVERLWDAANVVMDIVSLADNVSHGRWGSAAVDAGSLLVDVAATIIPGVPGGVATVVKAGRAADNIVDAARTVDNAADVARSVDNAVDAAQQLERLSGFARYGDEITDSHTLIHASGWRDAERQLENFLGAPQQRFYARDVPGMNISTYRTPDMVGMSFVGVSKFYTKSTLGGSRIKSQIGDYIEIAKQEGKTFHLFVHVDTAISDEIVELVGKNNIFRVFTGP